MKHIIKGKKCIQCGLRKPLPRVCPGLNTGVLPQNKGGSMKKLIGAMVMLMGMLIASSAQAQTALSVNINRAVLAWDWSPGVAPDDGVPTEFRIKCGQQTGTVSKITVVDSTRRTAPIRDIIAGNGQWFCHLTAANEFGESGASSEVPFVAGAAPSSPVNVRVQAQ